MASRAPTLAKPKTKPKVTTKKIVAKSSTPQATVALKSVTKTTAKATKVAPAKSKASDAKLADKVTKPVIAKTAPAKVTIKHDAHKSPAKPKSIASDSSAGNASAPTAGTASFEAPAPKPRRRTKAEIRTRIYWAVFNQSLRRVAVFEFDQREEAEKRAAKLTQSSGEHHFLQKIKALVQQ